MPAFPRRAFLFAKANLLWYYNQTMAVPRHHMAKGKQLRRRSHLALQGRALIKCQHCGKMIMPHQVCKFCGYYKGTERVGILARELAKREKRMQNAQNA